MRKKSKPTVGIIRNPERDAFWAEGAAVSSVGEKLALLEQIARSTNAGLVIRLVNRKGNAKHNRFHWMVHLMIARSGGGLCHRALTLDDALTKVIGLCAQQSRGGQPIAAEASQLEGHQSILQRPGQRISDVQRRAYQQGKS